MYGTSLSQFPESALLDSKVLFQILKNNLTVYLYDI